MRVILIDRSPVLCHHWSTQIKKFLQAKCPLEFQGRSVSLEVCNKDIGELQVTGTTAVVVTPGNSAGLMGGGIDMAIRDCFVGVNSSAETVQNYVLNKLQYYKPPGSPTVIHFDDEMIRGSIALESWNCRQLIHLPTMRVPEKIRETSKEFHKSLFDWTWNALSVLTNKVDALVIPGLGTGYGAAPLDICANTMVAAIAIHYAKDFTPMEKTVLIYKFLGEDYRKLDIPTLLDHNLDYDPSQGLDQLFAHTTTQ